MTFRIGFLLTLRFGSITSYFNLTEKAKGAGAKRSGASKSALVSPPARVQMCGLRSELLTKAWDMKTEEANSLNALFVLFFILYFVL